MTQMNVHHRINVWRIANVCPVCGEERGYSPANPGGIECYCSNDNCGYSEFFSNAFIHNMGNKNDNARFEVLDSNNKVKDGWYYLPTKSDEGAMKLRVEKCKQVAEYHERTKNRIHANLLNIVHCRKKDGGIKIKKCIGCSFCKEHGVEDGIGEFSDCLYPLK